jgi:hypothetical protein
MDPVLERLRWMAALLDSRFRVPGTEIRFGLDPVLDLIPGIGDLVSPIFALVLIVLGLRQRVPKIILAKMLLNAFIDALIGALPIAGPIGDVFWRANLMNLELLERHAQPGRLPSRSDYLFVFGIAALFGMVIAIPVGLGIFLMFWLVKHIGAL